VECSVATAEYTILRKLTWYRAGGETSERQWNDLRGVLKVSGKTSEQRWNDLRSVVLALGETLDLTYLHHWAEYLKVSDLLESLLSE